jgi:hypothetical protein
MQVDVDAGGGNDGWIIVRVGDDQIRLGNLDQDVITSFALGAANQSTSLGSTTSARATATRCCWPPRAGPAGGCRRA